MTRMIDPILLDSHDVYHLRYGRGAILIAIRRDPDGSAKSERYSLDNYVAKLFNARSSGGYEYNPTLEPVLSLHEEEGFVRVVIQFEHRNHRITDYNPLFAKIERTIPREQVTLEVVQESERIEKLRRRFP